MLKKMKFCISTIIYAIVYSFCLYKNLGGATFPFFVIGTLFYMQICLREFNLSLKKDSLFYMIAAALIGLSTVLTTNEFIIGANVIITFLLLFWIFIQNFTDYKKKDLFSVAMSFVISFFGGLGHIFAPFSDYSKIKAEHTNSEDSNAPKKPSVVLPVIITILICIPVLIVVIFMLTTADAVFSEFCRRIYDIDLGISLKTFIGSTLLAIVVFLYTYGYVTYLKNNNSTLFIETKKHNTPAAVTALIMFDTVYLIFSVIQIFYLFIGKFELPYGYSYAEYAREGFFQLLFVCILNFIIVAIGTTFFKRTKLLNILLSIMCGCTFIMILSSGFRMILYIRYFYFSFERILVLWALVLITFFVAGLLIYVWKPEFNIVKFLMTSACVLYLCLSFSHPDYFIAKWNLSQSGNLSSEFFIETNGYSDYDYLYRDLSKDAAPILLKDSTFISLHENYIDTCDYKTISIRKFNASKAYAKYLSKKLYK